MRGFEALFPHAGTLSCVICLDPQLFLLVHLHANVGPPSPQPTASPGLSAAALPTPVLQPLPCHESSLPRRSSPPLYGLDECFLFNSLVVRLLYSSIFWHFWLFFIFKFVVVLPLVEEAQCVYLCLYLGWKSYVCAFSMQVPRSIPTAHLLISKYYSALKETRAP